LAEKYTDLEHTVDTLVSLKRKSGISDKKIQTELIKFIYEPTDSLPHQRKIKRIVEVTLGKSNLTKIKNKVGKVLAKR